MNLNDLPNEIVTRCFSHLSTELLTDIILLENIPDNVLEAAVNNLNHLWYSERIQGIQRGDIENRIEGIEAYYETDFDRFLRIHKILDEKSLKCPLWFNYTWNNIHEMHKSLDEINLAYNGQKLGIHADIDNPAFEFYPIFSDHDINLKITCLSLILRAHSRGCVDLNDFPKLETFYGAGFKMEVNYDHPSLKNLYLNNVTISTLPINLIKLVIKNCVITMNENHPKLEALTVLALEDTQRPSDCSAIISVLWNKDLEHFSYISPGVSSDEILSMVGPKVTSFKLAGSISAEIPTSLRSLYSINNDGLTNLTAFTHMTSLTLWQPTGDINSFELPPNLLELTLYKPTGEIDSLNFPLSLVKLSIRVAKFKDLAKVDFPPNLVDLKLEFCRITSTVGWLKTARLKRLSLASNSLSSFHAVLPCCEFLCLKRNNLTAVDIEAPFLQHIDLYKNKLTSVPKLPSCVQVLLLDNNELYLPEMSDLPPNLKRLDLSGTGAFENYTFPSSLEQLSLENLASRMSGVKFAEGSRLRELNMSCCRLGTISDRKIQLPFGLKSLQLRYNHLRHINTLTIPQTVTSLGLQRNPLKSLKVKSHIETLYLNDNRLSSLTIPKDSELKYLDLKMSGLEKFSFDLCGAERLTQLCLGPEFKVIDVSKMPVSFQILEFPGSNSFEIEGLHRYPESDIWRRFS